MFWSSRRALLSAFLLIALFLLVRHTTSPDAQLELDGLDTTSPNTQSPSRSYPPPSAQQGKTARQQKVFDDITSKSLRARLEYYFPYDIEGKFPSYIWQTWKVGPSSGAFEDRLRPLEASWSIKHPSFVHEVISDVGAEHLIKYLFASVPEIIEAFTAMPVPVLKADFFRYLILLARGGVYSDIDTEALRSAFEWLPPDLEPSTVGLVVGIEADPDRPDWAQWYSRRIQFCQWTIQSKAGHPVLREIVAKITEKALSMKAHGQLKPGRIPTNVSIVEFTGPAIWTDTIFTYFNDPNYFEFDPKVGNVSVQNFFGVTSPKQLGDVIILPITSFSPGVGQMGAGEIGDPMAFVRHDFSGSWKPEEERMN